MIYNQFKSIVLIAVGLLWLGGLFELQTLRTKMKPVVVSFPEIECNVTVCPEKECNVTVCPKVELITPRAETAWYDYEQSRRLSDWHRERDYSHSAPLTQWAQTMIHQHQNPANCNGVRFMITDGHEWGMGSEVHVVGTHLAAAINEGLILAWGEQSVGGPRGVFPGMRVHVPEAQQLHTQQ